jgi:N-acetylmuramoyl-L-alanine amidase
VGYTNDGSQVAEKNLTLAIALKTAARLRADGVSVTLSRSGDGLDGSTPADYSPDGNMLTPDGVLTDLQRRIDRANASGARVFLSIHMNAYSDPSIGGSETFYDSARPFADQNQRFAQLVQSSLISALRAQAYTTPDRGITDDASLQTEDLGVLQGTYNHLILLGPPVPGRVRPTEMPGALSEPMFVSDPDEATVLAQADVQDLLAGAYVRAIEQFLKSASA